MREEFCRRPQKWGERQGVTQYRGPRRWGDSALGAVSPWLSSALAVSSLGYGWDIMEEAHGLTCWWGLRRPRGEGTGWFCGPCLSVGVENMGLEGVEQGVVGCLQ